MTALTEYQRLETPGIWRASPQAQRRDVIVSVGDATLVIYDGASRPLAHWSLAALERENPGLRPALYRPGADSPEELELTDAEMIAAIERVASAIRSRRPREGRLRYVLLAGALVGVVALAVLWLPGALIGHAASVVPAAKRADLGERLLVEIHRVAGAPCGTPLGNRALDVLHGRLIDGPGRLVVLPGGIATAAHLPGHIVLLNRALVEDFEDPNVVAGFILAETLRARGTDPVESLLTAAGPMAAFRLLTTGDVERDALAAYAETLMTAPMAPLPDGMVLTRFLAADVPVTPYAYALDVTGETTIGLIEADPVEELMALPVLRDAEWVSLQGICGE